MHYMIWHVLLEIHYSMHLYILNKRKATCASYTCTTPGWSKKSGTGAETNHSEDKCCEALLL